MQINRKHICYTLIGIMAFSLLSGCMIGGEDKVGVASRQINESIGQAADRDQKPVKADEANSEKSSETLKQQEEQNTEEQQQQGEQEIPKEQQMPQEQQTPEPEPIVEPIEFKGSQELKEKYKAILLGEEDFIRYKIEDRINIGDVRSLISSDERIMARVVRFTIIDLDGNGEDEIVLWIQRGWDDSWWSPYSDWDSVTLYCFHQDIYGITQYYRAFRDIKADGTFWSSGGAAYSGASRIKFVDRDWGYERYDVSSEGFDEKPDAPAYDFTQENIELVFGD